MASVTSFIRNTPAASLRAYFDHSGITLPVPVNWEAPEPEVVRPLLRAVDEMDEASRARVLNDAERVGSMADEAGQTASPGTPTNSAISRTRAVGRAGCFCMPGAGAGAPGRCATPTSVGAGACGTASSVSRSWSRSAIRPR